MPKLAVLDLIGTVIRDSGLVTDAFQRTAYEFDLELDERRLHSLRGLSKRDALQRLLPNANAYESFVRNFMVALEEVGAEPVPDAHRVMMLLRQSGTKVALTTGLERVLAERILVEAGLPIEYFDAVICDDGTFPGRPAPFMIFNAMQVTAVHDVATVAVIGDTVADLEAGANARAGWVIGVHSGAQPAAQLVDRSPTVLVGSVAELPKIFGLDA